MKRIVNLVSLIIAALCFGAGAESTAVIEPKISRYDDTAMPKDPLASAFFSATICGTGQIYNKEYLRGIATGAAFWTCFFGAEYLLYRWKKLNTDTFYIEEYYEPDVIHQVTALKPENEQVGLPIEEKVLLVSAVITGAGAYLFGIYDSYTGAKRYNRKLVASSAIRPAFYCSLGRTRTEAGVRLNF